ncbi:MAG: O-antigen ligase family protein [Nitrospirae bacterium]|nr:O-antigen ligase family protein [Nitrospirota bacterium]
MHIDKLKAFYIHTVKALIFLLPLLPLYVSMSLMFPYIEGRNHAFRIIVELSAVFWAGLLVLDKQYRPRYSPVFSSILIFTFIAGLADILGVNPYKSLWSGFERMEGYITILHLALYFMIIRSVLRTNKDWAIFFNIFISASAIVGLYALFNKLVAGNVYRESSTIGHPAFLASYMLLTAFIGLILSLHAGRTWLKYTYLTSAVINLIVVYFTATRGAIIAVLSGIIFFSLFYIFSRCGTPGERLYRKIALSALAACIILPVIVLTSYKQPSSLPPELEFQSALPRFATASIDASISSRTDAWKVAWEGFKAKPVLGWGQENFTSLYTLRPVPYGGKTSMDRAHNIIMDWLVNAGIAGLLSYLSLFGAAFFVIRRQYLKNVIAKIEAVTLTTALAVYFVQNLPIFDTLNSYLVFFTLLAYIDNLEGPEKLPPPVSKSDQDRLQVKSLAAAFIALCFFSGAAYFIHYKSARESYLATRIMFDFKENKYRSFLTVLDDFKKALSLNTFGNTEVRLLMLNISGEILRNRTFAIEGAVKFVETTAAETKNLIADDFYNLERRVMVVDFYHDIAVYEPSFISKAEGIIRECMKISPDNQWNYFALADNYILKKDYENAFLAIKKAVDMDPHNEFVQVKMALAGILTSRKDAADDALEKVRKLRVSKYDIIASGKKYFLTDDELLAFANAAEVAKDYDNALRFYNKLIELFPESAPGHFGIAGIYLKLGDRDSAIKEAQKAAELDPVNFSGRIKEIIE